MKIKNFIEWLSKKYDNNLKIFKKGIFWILVNEDAFFIHKVYNLKITMLDKETIKVWFPESSKDKRLNFFKERNIGYSVFYKKEDLYIEVDYFRWDNYTKNFVLNIEEYTLTKERILWLKKIWLEEKNESNFLLKDKLEDIYVLVIDLLIRLPKKERFFFREKIERIFLNLFEDTYSYMYNLWNRKEELEKIFRNCMLLREYFRLLYKIWKKIWVVSAFRSYAYQVNIKANWCPDNFCAKAWFSEHQTWLVVDIFEASDKNSWYNNWVLMNYYKWLSENAHLYWFHNTYQKWLNIDWYEVEPWHWRYLWVELATYLFDNKLTIAEYYNLKKLNNNLILNND